MLLYIYFNLAVYVRYFILLYKSSKIKWDGFLTKEKTKMTIFTNNKIKINKITMFPHQAIIARKNLVKQILKILNISYAKR